MKRTLAAAVAVLALAAALPAGASAADPGRWSLATVSLIPVQYYQGVTAETKLFEPQLFFTGFVGIFRTDNKLNETGRTDPVIPAPVKAAEGFNHIGDLSYDRRQGGRLLLPLECYYPGTPTGANTCGNGAIAVADPQTMQ